MVALNGAIAGLPAGLSEVHASLSGDGNTVATRLIVRRETTDEGVRRLCQAMLRVPGIDGAWTDKAGRSVEAGQVHLAGLIATGASKKFRVRGGNFHQSSPPVNAAMVAAARAEVGAGRGDLVVDLHGGAGNFGLAIAPSGADVSIAEIDPWAYEDLARNTAVFRGRGKVRAAALPGDQLLLRIAKRGAVRAVVFDPPRIGDPASARRIAEVLPQTVVAFGCDPATSARDFATMGMGGVYRLTRLSLWDAFPGTHHSEILAVLERGS
jgi:tRNA/tmRNA/rRNA uracil-C5-methylase (TrmA/RlmC/RlmD family)